MESQCINLPRLGHEDAHMTGDKADLPIVRIILSAEMRSEVEC